MSADFNAADAEPSSTEYSVAWSPTRCRPPASSLLLGPLDRLLISYVRRDAPGPAFWPRTTAG